MESDLDEKLLADILMSGNLTDALEQCSTSELMGLLAVLQPCLSQPSRQDQTLSREMLLDQTRQILDNLLLQYSEPDTSGVTPLDRLNLAYTDDRDCFVPVTQSKTWSGRVRERNDSSERIPRVPQARTHWLTPEQISEKSPRGASAETVARLNVLLGTISASNESIVLGDEPVSIRDLIGFYSTGQRVEWKCDPRIEPFLLTLLRPSTFPPQQGSTKWITTTEMVERIYHSGRSWHTRLLKEKAVELICQGDRTINVRGEPRRAGDMVTFFLNNQKGSEGKGVLYWDDSIQEYLMDQLDRTPLLGDEKRHFVSTNQILKDCSFFGNRKLREPARVVLRQMVESLLQQEQIELPNPTTGGREIAPAGDVIVFARWENADSYFVDPRLLLEILTPEKIKQAAIAYKESAWTRESGQPRTPPEDRRHWITASQVARQCTLKTPEDRQATEMLLKKLYEMGHESVDYFGGRGYRSGVYVADPDRILSVIRPEHILEQKVLLKQQPREATERG